MKHITYEGMLRHESDEIAEVLIGKGWVEAPLPTLLEGQQCDWIDGKWVVSDVANPSAESELKAYVDPVEGIEIDTSPAAQSRFTSLVALIREGLDFGALTNESKQEIRDIHGGTHSLTVLRIRALMLRYGLHCKALFDRGEGKDGEAT